MIIKSSIEEYFKFRCDPVTIAGLVVAAAGTGTQIAASSAENSSMNSDVAAELSQQAQLQKQGQAAVQSNIAANTPKAFNQNVATGTQEATNAYQAAQSIPLTTPIGSGSSAPTVGATQDKEVSSAQGKTQVGLSNATAAPLQGYTDAGVQQWIKNLQTNTALGQIGQFSQEDASLLPIQLRAAQNSESGLAGFGSLLGTAGGLLSLYGATNPVKGATSGVGSVGSTVANTPTTAAGDVNWNKPFYQTSYAGPGW